MEQVIQRIAAVINTLNGAMIRADQVDAVRRIDACTQELKKLIQELDSAGREKGEGA